MRAPSGFHHSERLDSFQTLADWSLNTPLNQGKKRETMETILLSDWMLARPCDTWVSSASVHSTGHHEGCFYKEEKARRGSQHTQGHTAAEPEGGSSGRWLPAWLRSPLPTGLTEELGAQNCVLNSPILPHLTLPQGRKMQCCRWRSGKESVCQRTRPKRCGFNPWIRKVPWRRKWQCHFLSLAGSWGHKESDRTEWRNSHTSESWQVQHLESKCSKKDMKMVRVSSSFHFWRCILKTIPCFCQQIETLFLSQIFLIWEYSFTRH